MIAGARRSGVPPITFSTWAQLDRPTWSLFQSLFASPGVGDYIEVLLSMHYLVSQPAAFVSGQQQIDALERRLSMVVLQGAAVWAKRAHDLPPVVQAIQNLRICYDGAHAPAM